MGEGNCTEFQLLCVCVLLLCSKRDVQGRVLVLGFVSAPVIFFRKFCASLLLAPLLYDMTV